MGELVRMLIPTHPHLSIISLTWGDGGVCAWWSFGVNLGGGVSPVVLTSTRGHEAEPPSGQSCKDSHHMPNRIMVVA